MFLIGGKIALTYCIIFYISEEVESVIDSSDEYECLDFLAEPSSNCVSSYDISSSSLIKSPLVSELLMSHGLLQNGHVEDRPLCNSDAESKVSCNGF